MNEELKQYIQTQLFPEYAKNEEGHRIEHINYVIERSLKFASQVPDINMDMVYTIAAYHDIGHHIDAKNHEKVSAEMLLQDKELKKIFTEEQIKIMSEAVADHRASSEYEPRSIYGKIVSSADRNTDVNMVLKRTYTYTKAHNPSFTLEEIIEDSRRHIIQKFGKDGYAIQKMYFKDPQYEAFLATVDDLTSNKENFTKIYKEVNKINVNGVNGDGEF